MNEHEADQSANKSQAHVTQQRVHYVDRQAVLALRQQLPGDSRSQLETLHFREVLGQVVNQAERDALKRSSEDAEDVVAVQQLVLDPPV